MNRDELRAALRLYAVTDRTWLGERSLFDVVEQALRGGVTMMQLREKNQPQAQVLDTARMMSELCSRYRVPFLVNDDVQMALACGADGVHVGQNDLAAREARALLGADKLLGVSASTVEEARAAEQAGADYLGVGAVFPTKTKRDADSVSLQTLSAICRAVSIPVVAIGGITAQNLSSLHGCGLAGVAVVSALFAASDIQAAAQTLLALSQEAVL